MVQCDLDEAKIDGASYRIPGLPPLIFLNRRQPADRLRFSLANEIGHLVMHTYPNPNMEQEAKRSSEMPGISSDSLQVKLPRSSSWVSN